MRYLRIPRHAHDFEIACIGTERTFADRLANRIFAGPESACGRLRDNRHPGSEPIFCFCKIATAHDRDTEQREITWRNVIVLDRIASLSTRNREKIAEV